MNKTIKRNVLLTAALTIMLCVSLIAGATFALFTSESKVNIAVTSGKVDVVATVENLDLKTTLASGNLSESRVNSDGNEVTLDKIVPGDYVTFNIKIHNNSDVTVKYRTVIEKIEDDGLWNGLEVEIDGVAFTGENAVKSEWDIMNVGCEDINVSVKVALPETVDSAYQGKTCKFAYTVEALQGNAIPADEWDGTTTEEPTIKEDGFYHITNAAEFMEVMYKSQNYATTNVYYNKTIVLDKDIDLQGATITGFGKNGSHFYGNFDGNGYTVSNFSLKNDGVGYYTGLFNYVLAGSTIKNITVKNATILGSGKGMAGAVIGAIYGDSNSSNIIKSHVENCHAINCTVYGEKKVGGVVGYINTGVLVDNCTATNCNIYCEVSAETESAGIKPQAGAVVGFNNGNGGIVTNSNDNGTNTITFDAKYIDDGVVLHNGVYEISNANGMFWFDGLTSDKQYNKNITLVADIDLKNRAWTPICYSGTQYNGTFDGNGHTIYNLKVTAPADAGANEGFGLFAWSNGTIKNLTIDGAEISANHYTGTIVGYMQTGTIDNCHVKNAKVTNTHMDNDKCGDKAGALVGYANCNLSEGVKCTITNCSATDCTVKAGRDAGQLIGCSYNGNTHENNTATNVTVTAGGDCTGANVNNNIIGRI